MSCTCEKYVNQHYSAISLNLAREVVSELGTLCSSNLKPLPIGWIFIRIF